MIAATVMKKKETSKHRIYRILRRQLITGHLAPGDRFGVQALADEFEVSVTPVRDALQMLSQEGLVDIRPRSGYFVRQVTLKELRDLLDLRKILELAAVERAALRIQDEQLEALRHVHAGYTGDDDVSYERYTEENRRFHVLLAQAGGNQELAETLGHLHDRLARFMVLTHSGQTQAATHARLIAALEAHDLPAARQAMIDEVDATRDVILDEVLRDVGR